MFMEQINNYLPHFILWAAALTLVGMIVYKIVRKVEPRTRTIEVPLASSRPPSPEEIEALVKQELEENLPLCPCGMSATHPAPKLVRKRIGFLQTLFAMAPRYHRIVPPNSKNPKLVFCEIHAHVADSMMDKFIYEEIRAKQSTVNEEIAIRAAAFEQEALLERIKESLTESQKKQARAVSAQVTAKVRQLRAVNGSDSVLS